MAKEILKQKYSGPHLMWSRLILSPAYCSHLQCITVHCNKQKKLVNVIIRLCDSCNSLAQSDHIKRRLLLYCIIYQSAELCRNRLLRQRDEFLVQQSDVGHVNDTLRPVVDVADVDPVEVGHVQNLGPVPRTVVVECRDKQTLKEVILLK